MTVCIGIMVGQHGLQPTTLHKGPSMNDINSISDFRPLPCHHLFCYYAQNHIFFEFLIPLLPPLKDNDFIYELASDHIVIKTTAVLSLD